MHALTGPFNSQVDSGQLALDALTTRLYGLHNTRGPFLYPQSPYALGPNMVPAMGDIVPMAAMEPIGESTLFTTLPTPGQFATSVAPIGSAGFPTFRATAPPTTGTVLGPAGSTIPAAGQIAASYTSAYGDPAATLSQAAQGQGSAGPITYTTPFPSIVAPPPLESFEAPPSFWCQVGTWVNDNPLGAALGIAAAYFVLKGGKN